MTFTKTQLALSIAAATLSLAVLAPQAQAASVTTVQQTANDAADKANALELQMQQMADQMKAMQAELNRVKASADKAANADSKVQELDQWMASVKHAPDAPSAKDHLFAVRGGWENLDHARSTNAGLLGQLTNGGLLSNNTNPSGYYYGGYMDFNVNNDLFGLVDDTSFLVEFGLEYASFGSKGNNALVNSAVSPLTPGTLLASNSPQSTDARLRINASPKIKFMHGSKFRPWIIPVGLDINILGVPSNAVSVLSSGMNFGAGAEYDLFRGIVLGVDGRYHYSTNNINGTPTDGFNLGGYVGFKF